MLKNHIEDIRAGIKLGRYTNEASVSQGIVLRLLQVLGWPMYDTQIVCPEYSLEGRRVDYALCHPRKRPVAFIEVKQVGQSMGAERQLFEYAFHIGVPLAILTDGQEWNFFLPAEQGDYTERRVYKLDIIERDIEESVIRLERYLGYAQVSSGQAIALARDDYRNISRDRQMLSSLPEAWTKLVNEEDDLLLELLAGKVENLCGFKPDFDTVAKFLREKLFLSNSNSTNSRRISQLHPVATQTEAVNIAVVQNSQSAHLMGFTINSKFQACNSGVTVLISVFEELSASDASFLERFSARPRHGRTRRFLARSPKELYPDRPDLANGHSFRLKSGWYIGTNVSKAQIRRIVEMACEVAGLQFGNELSINIG